MEDKIQDIAEAEMKVPADVFYLFSHRVLILVFICLKQINYAKLKQVISST